MDYSESDHEHFDPDGENVLSRETVEHEIMTDVRSQLRRVVLQVLYQLDSHEQTVDEVLKADFVYDTDAGTVKDMESYLARLWRGIVRAADTSQAAEAAIQDGTVSLNDSDALFEATERDVGRLVRAICQHLKTAQEVVSDEGAIITYLTGLDGTIRHYKAGWMATLTGVSSRTLGVVLFAMGMEQRYHIACQERQTAHYERAIRKLAACLRHASKTYEDVQQVAGGIAREQEAIDTVLQHYAPEYPMDQVAIIDRNILRLALYELTLETVPVSVVIDEAVNLAKFYGAEGAPRFVNGVLGAIAEDIDGVREALSILRVGSSD